MVSNGIYEWYLTTISVDLGFLWHFVLLKLKTCLLYHENLFIQKFPSLGICINKKEGFRKN